MGVVFSVVIVNHRQLMRTSWLELGKRYPVLVPGVHAVVGEVHSALYPQEQASKQVIPQPEIR